MSRPRETPARAIQLTLIAFRDGSSATGPIVLANVTFGEFTVEGQAFSAYHTRATAPYRSHACP